MAQDRKVPRVKRRGDKLAAWRLGGQATEKTMPNKSG